MKYLILTTLLSLNLYATPPSVYKEARAALTSLHHQINEQEAKAPMGDGTKTLTITAAGSAILLATTFYKEGDKQRALYYFHYLNTRPREVLDKVIVVRTITNDDVWQLFRDRVAAGFELLDDLETEEQKEQEEQEKSE